MAFKQTEAIKRAEAQLGDAYPAGWCQKWVVIEVFASGGVGDFDGDRAADAEDGWKAAKKKVAVTSANAASIPAGYPLYFVGGRNDHGHAAVSAGNGQMYSTDLNAGKPRYGRIGKTSIKTAEQAWGVKLVGYVITDGNGNTFTDPAKTPPKPAPPKVEPEPWFGIDFRNLAGFNDEGARTLDKRMPKTVADIKEVGRPVVAVVELPNPKVAAFSKLMKAIGYSHAAGDLGRHIYVETGMPTVGAKVFDLKPRLRKDDKQGVAVQVTPSTTPALIVTAQLENEDASGNTQVAQANHLVDQGEEYADKRGIPHSRIIWALDTNSFNRVRTEVFERRGYVDAFDVAHSAENTEHQSFVPWGGKPVKGDRIDLIAVHKSRPVRRARLRLTPILADHLDMFADIGTTTKK
jgi:hypothetical protein